MEENEKMKKEIEMTQDDIDNYRNGYGMKDGSSLMIRKVMTDDSGTDITGLHITDRGKIATFHIDAKVSSIVELIEEMRKAGL